MIKEYAACVADTQGLAEFAGLPEEDLVPLRVLADSVEGRGQLPSFLYADVRSAEPDRCTWMWKERDSARVREWLLGFHRSEGSRA